MEGGGVWYGGWRCVVWRVEVCGVEGGGVWRVKYYIGIGSVEKMERRVCCMCVCEEWSVEGEDVCLTTLEILSSRPKTMFSSFPLNQSTA